MNDEMIDPEKMKALEADVSRLPRSIDAPDVWPDIRAAIERESVLPIAGGARRGNALRYWQRPGFLVAAAAALVATTSTTTFLALRREPAAVPAASTSAARTPSSFAQFAARENGYIETANRLESLIESTQSNLTPETIAKLKQSLAIIDAAILEAREALAADPANKNLVDMLSSSYDKKLDLLRRSAAMGRS